MMKPKTGALLLVGLCMLGAGAGVVARQTLATGPLPHGQTETRLAERPAASP